MEDMGKLKNVTIDDTENEIDFDEWVGEEYYLSDEEELEPTGECVTPNKRKTLEVEGPVLSQEEEKLRQSRLEQLRNAIKFCNSNEEIGNTVKISNFRKN